MLLKPNLQFPRRICCRSGLGQIFQQLIVCLMRLPCLLAREVLLMSVRLTEFVKIGIIEATKVASSKVRAWRFCLS